MTSLFDTKFRLHSEFDNLDEDNFTEKLSEVFDISVCMSKLLYACIFSYKSVFIYSDLETLMDKPDLHRFLANNFVLL